MEIYIEEIPLIQKKNLSLRTGRHWKILLKDVVMPSSFKIVTFQLDIALGNLL